MSLHVQNEKSTLLLDLAFMDEDDIAVVPTAATYRIDDFGGTAILAETAITGLASTKTLEITVAQNRILGTGVDDEMRRVTVGFDYGTGRHRNDVYVYRLANLNHVT